MRREARGVVYIHWRRRYWKLFDREFAALCQNILGQHDMALHMSAYGAPLKTEPWWIRVNNDGPYSIHRTHKVYSPETMSKDELEAFVG